MTGSYAELESGAVDEATAAIRDAVLRAGRAGEFRVVSGTEINWRRVGEAHGKGAKDYEAAARWAAGKYAVLVVLETAGGGLSRGVYQIAEAFQAARKPIRCWRDGRSAPVQVAEWDTTNWKLRWGRAVDR